MIIQRPASAGTLESSDCMVTVAPPEEPGVTVELESVVMEQYGEDILSVARQTLRALGVENALVRIQDKGALDCVIAARVEAAVLRSGEEAAV